MCWGNNADILAFDLEGGDMTTLVNGTGLGNLDGIDVDGSGQYYVSSWSPTRITRFSNDFADAETVVTGAGGLSSPADISYAVGIDTLGVANSGSDEVTFHGFGGTPSGIEESTLWTATIGGTCCRSSFPSGAKSNGPPMTWRDAKRSAAVNGSPPAPPPLCGRWKEPAASSGWSPAEGPTACADRPQLSFFLPGLRKR